MGSPALARGSPVRSGAWKGSGVTQEEVRRVPLEWVGREAPCLLGKAQQKLPMDMLVLEDEKNHGAPSLALQKVKVSVRRTQPLCLGDRTGS